jgi:hypothetical protein
MCKEDPSKLYKIGQMVYDRFAREHDVFFTKSLRLYILKERIICPESDYFTWTS